MVSNNLTTHELAKKWLSEPDKIILAYDKEFGPELAEAVDERYVKLTPDGSRLLLVQDTPDDGFQPAVCIR